MHQSDVGNIEAVSESRDDGFARFSGLERATRGGDAGGEVGGANTSTSSNGEGCTNGEESETEYVLSRPAGEDVDERPRRSYVPKVRIPGASFSPREEDFLGGAEDDALSAQSTWFHFGLTNHLTPSPNTTQSILGETVRGAGQAASPWKSVKFEAELPEGFPERTANASRRVSLSRTSRLSGLSLVFLVFGCMWLSRVLHIFSQKIFKSLMGDLGEEL